LGRFKLSIHKFKWHLKSIVNFKKMKILILVTILSISIRANSQSFVEAPNAAEKLYKTQLVDVNGDDKLDVIGVKFNANIPLYVGINTTEDGIISFEEHIYDFRLNGIPATGDFDSDGDIDIVVAKYQDDQTILYINDGLGNFEIHEINVAEADIFRVADLDGDADLDIVALNSADPSLYMFINEGGLSFTKVDLLINESDLFRIDIGDIDQDNDMDIILGYEQFFHTKISILENTGDLAFAENVIYDDTEPGALGQIDIHDITNNGSNEIVFSSTNRNFLYALVRDGNEGYTFNKLVQVNGNISGFGLGDFNNDQKSDLILGTHDEDVTLHLNTNVADLEYDSEIIHGASPISYISAGDLDNDNDVDLYISYIDSWCLKNEISLVHTKQYITQKIKVFPNPISHLLNIENPNNQYLDIKLINASGQIVLKKLGVTHQLNCSNIEDGMYYLLVKSENEEHLNYRTKIIIQK